MNRAEKLQDHGDIIVAAVAADQPLLVIPDLFVKELLERNDRRLLRYRGIPDPRKARVSIRQNICTYCLDGFHPCKEPGCPCVCRMPLP